MTVSLGSVASVVPHRDESARLAEILSKLYAEQLTLTSAVPYLREHAQSRVVNGQVAVFRWYRQFLPAAGTLLDWGCNHAPDSCLLRVGR